MMGTFTFPKKCSEVPCSLSRASAERTRSMKLMLSIPSDEQVLSVMLINDIRSLSVEKIFLVFGRPLAGRILTGEIGVFGGVL